MQSKILCTRLLQTLDSEERFGVPYGTPSPFEFAFRDCEFSRGSREYKYYIQLRECKDIEEYRRHAIDLYKDLWIEVEIQGEVRKFPIQKIKVPEQAQREWIVQASKNGYEDLIPTDTPLVFLSSLPAPRLMGSPPQGKSRSDFLKLPTNKVIDIALLVVEDEVDEGYKYLASEISKALSPMESTLASVWELSKYLKSYISQPIGISLRGTMADNPAVFENAFRVPSAAGTNFFETSHTQHWPTLDIDLDIFCGEEDFEDIYATLGNRDIFWDDNAIVKGLHMAGAKTPLQFLKESASRSIEIYLMTDDWVLTSVQRHRRLGLEQPWAYYYASSYPLFFDDWEGYMQSLLRHIFS